jgi:RimJ/RimL family protein N-acetyltransferase
MDERRGIQNDSYSGEFVVMGLNQEIQTATASEPLSLDQEYAMQSSWRADHDKLTFIACLPIKESIREAKAGTVDAPARMIGDVNLFLSEADEDPEGCIGELELMIAPTTMRRQGYGRATILAFLHYIQTHIQEILTEYKKSRSREKMSLLQLKVKIGSKNDKSIQLFESIGFVKVDEGPNYFGEIELVFEGFLGEDRTTALLNRYGVDNYREIPYGEEEILEVEGK